MQFAVDRGLPNRWLVGWSFGTELALMYGATEPVASEIEGAVLLSPPLHRATDVHLKEWAEAGKPLKVLVPEHDDYLQPAAAAASASRWCRRRRCWASTAPSTCGWGRSTPGGFSTKSWTRSSPAVPDLAAPELCFRRNGTGRSPRRTPEPPKAQKNKPH